VSQGGQPPKRRNHASISTTTNQRGKKNETDIKTIGKVDLS
jgi:hypothetical protein